MKVIGEDIDPIDVTNDIGEIHVIDLVGIDSSARQGEERSMRERKRVNGCLRESQEVLLVACSFQLSAKFFQ